MQKEQMANEFAMAFLMPEKEFKKCVEQYTENGICNTKAVAKHFGVTVSIASLRGQHLGLFESIF